MSAVRLNSLGTRRGDLELALPDLSAVGISGLQAVRGCQEDLGKHLDSLPDSDLDKIEKAFQNMVAKPKPKNNF